MDDTNKEIWQRSVNSNSIKTSRALPKRKTITIYDDDTLVNLMSSGDYIEVVLSVSVKQSLKGIVEGLSVVHMYMRQKEKARRMNNKISKKVYRKMLHISDHGSVA